ncbi:type II toxin-antitoxin system VapC family toxin [Mucilaginibacter sp.]|uniref:type II toxin-antitoxin system VapC family toxin n=1 Tax=Mucilaginibacter sp. TaxID=1882438 RepID=UPI003B00A761
MADNLILADTSILIDYFRKSDKSNSVLIALFDQGYDFSISAITHYEIYSGATVHQMPFWTGLLNRTKVLPFDEAVSQIAINLNSALKSKRKQIGMADLFIAATSISHNLTLSTLNKKHFERIDGLSLIE